MVRRRVATVAVVLPPVVLLREQLRVPLGRADLGVAVVVDEVLLELPLG